MSSNQNMKTNSTSNSFMNNNDIIAKVVIERFPSRNEIINFLNTFLKNNHYQKDYEIDTKDKVIIIKFKQFVFIIIIIYSCYTLGSCSWFL